MKNKFQRLLLIAIFFASGFSSLVYQVSWQRILTLYYSVENISTTLIVSVYMLGLGLGAIIGGRLAEKISNKILLYFLIELSIGFFGYISVPFLEFLGKHTAGSNYLMSFIYMFAFLCIPTILMGMTLPLLTKIFNKLVNNFLQSLSYLYFINTLGAAAGAIITSYIFISFWGLDTSIYFAVTINIIIAAFLFFSRKRLANGKADMQEDPTTVTTYHDNHIYSIEKVYSIVFVTGFIAIGYEIIWFRIIGVILKASPYSFSSVLAVYLLGIAAGSYLMKKYLSKNTKVNRRNLFFTFQVAISLFVLISLSAYYYLVNHVTAVYNINLNSFNQLLHPSLDGPYNHRIGTLVMWVVHKTEVITWPAIFILLPTLLMGASFPLITSMAYINNQEGNTVGRIYFFNVLGNVAGGLLTGLVFLGTLGTEYSVLLFSFIGLVFIFFNGNGLYISGIKYKLAAVLIIVVLSLFFFPRRHQLYATVFPKKVMKGASRQIITEGVDGVIVTYDGANELCTFINGETHGGRPVPLFYYEAFQAMSFKKDMKKVLVIGFGTGSTVEAIEKLSPTPEITLVELNKTLLNNLEQVKDLNTIIHNKNVHLIYADGRKFLYNSKEKYDAVFLDPLRTTTSFSNNLYSSQFFMLIKEHLTSDGVFMLWMDEHHIVPKTLASVFPYIYKYSFFSVTSNSEMKKNDNYKKSLFELFPPSLSKAMKNIDTAEQHPKDRNMILIENLKFPINDDYKPVCEYYLGMEYTARKAGMPVSIESKTFFQ